MSEHAVNEMFFQSLAIVDDPWKDYEPYPLPLNPTSNDRLYRELMIAKHGRGDPIVRFTREKMREDGFFRQIFPSIKLLPLMDWLHLGIPLDQLSPATGSFDYYEWMHEKGLPLRSYYRRWFNDFFDDMMFLLRRMTKSEWKSYYGKLRTIWQKSKSQVKQTDEHNQVVQAATMRIVGQIAAIAARTA